MFHYPFAFNTVRPMPEKPETQVDRLGPFWTALSELIQAFFVRNPSKSLQIKCGTNEFRHFENEFHHFENKFHDFGNEFQSFEIKFLIFSKENFDFS